MSSSYSLRQEPRRDEPELPRLDVEELVHHLDVEELLHHLDVEEFRHDELLRLDEQLRHDEHPQRVDAPGLVQGAHLLFEWLQMHLLSECRLV